MSISQNFPAIRPTLSLNFARSRTLDPRITFTRSSIGTYFDREGIIRTAAVNQARFDHHPTTGESLGLLMEEQRTNLLTYSNDFGNANWVKQNGHPMTTNTVLGLDGELSADTFVRTSSDQYVYQNIGGNGTYVFSAWVRSANATGTFVMQPYNGTDGSPGATTFTATSTWQRFSIVSTTTVKGGSGWYPCIPVNLNETFYVWGAQLEATGAGFPSSYIPTSGSSVTRTADYALMTGTNFSNWFNPLEGTFVAQCDRGNDGTEAGGIGAARRSADSYFDMIQFGEFYNNGGHVGRIYVGGNAEAIPGAVHTTGQGIFNKYSFAYKVNDVSGAINGLIQGTDTSASIPTQLDRFIFGGWGDDRSLTSLDGRIRYLTYYPTRLTDTQLQTLTK